MDGTTDARVRTQAAWITIHSKRTFDDVLFRLYSEIGGPFNAGSIYHGWYKYHEINHDDWLHRAGIPSDGLQYRRVFLGNPDFAVEFSIINPKAGLAFPFEVLILEDHDGQVDLVFHLASLVIMTLIKDHSLNLRFLQMDVSLNGLLQHVASGVAGADNEGQENGGHENGGHENGGHENGGHENGGHENGGHENGGHQNGEHQNEGHENGGHQNGEHQNEGHENGGHQNGEHQNEGHENERHESERHENEEHEDSGSENGGQQNRRVEHRRHRSHTSAGHEFGPRENGAEEHGAPQQGGGKNGGTENEGQEDDRRPTLGGHEIERFRPIREGIEAKWMAAGSQAVIEDEEEEE